ncbi:hypothetical protein GHK45_32090 [Sinorhizobium meliloti]|uniref:DUF4760 domain-containing protein n=1 Tax=Rhizobium meliloti TaxID=382 RepID=A0A6A8A2R9_RHIML|nr:hypothetical protein [Sinorhizobium meliloti]MQW08207.1 hypothetical protein [Sinorhizobium meliloti]
MIWGLLTVLSSVPNSEPAYTWWRANTSFLDVLAGVASVATLAALWFAAVSVRHNTQARNLAVVVDLYKSLTEQREKAFHSNLYQMTEEQFYVFQMFTLMEHCCFLVNSKAVSGAARDFLVDWLDQEIPEIEDQQQFRDRLDFATGQQLAEYRTYRAGFETREAQRLEKRLRGKIGSPEHFDRVLDARRRRFQR